MRLKHLELQGYKTFASRTEFVFDGGITAIVGPNGSGKSNIADAIRWVLGEQSYRTLRGKRTEDMIFSGSAQRARLGMASASLLLDNAEGWLPIEFSEVVITRRAYRSGENEYRLNNRRVRLRDINELLSTSGLARRTYTVIGQGLVDAVLSLRADDRRALFEEAAGISLYQSKRAEALSRLEETRANLLRVNDIVNEIAPRMRRLEREAERAERYALLSQQLEGLLRTWYGYRWRQEHLNLRRAQDALSRRERVLAGSREALEAVDEQMTELRAHQARLRAQLGSWHRESGELHRQMEQVQRDLAVWQERSRLQAKQRDELRAELAVLETQAQAMVERVAGIEQEVTGHLSVLREKEGLVAQAQASLDAHEEQRSALSGQVAMSQAQAFDLAAQTADHRNRLAQLDERRAALAEERTGHEAAIVEQESHAAELAPQLRAAAGEQARIQSQRRSTQDELIQAETALVKVHQRQSELRDLLADAQRDVERLQARYDMLSRLREEGEGLHAGVRAVLQAAGASYLTGIVGTIAQLLQVPADFEVAIETALASHLQDVVVESWPNAEAAILYLKEGERGRATFLPLDTVRPAGRLRVINSRDVVGVAADLVRADERLDPVVEMLLGRTIVARDLGGARRTFDQLSGGFQIVTLAGEILRSSGSVTGGQGEGQTRGRVLGREREWRQLPGYLEKARNRCGERNSKLDNLQTAEEKVRSRITFLRAQLRQTEEELEKVQGRHQELERGADQTAQRIIWLQGLIEQLDGDLKTVDASEAALRADLDRLNSERESVEREVATLQDKLENLRGEALYQRLTEARTAAAVARGAWEHRRAALEEQRDQQVALEDQVEAKEERIASLDLEQESLAKQIRDQGARETVVQGWLSALAAKIEPAEVEIANLEAERDRLEKEEAAHRARLREAENRHSQAVLASSRQEDRLDRLRRQIMDDFGLVEMEPLEGVPEQSLLPLGELVSSLPAVEKLPAGLEEEIHQIKAQMRRMGSVNPGAPEEYGEVLDRHTFLTKQAADLEEAARSLREVIAELDEIMRQEFQATFKEVAARFKENFTQLFDGGTARLMLTDPEDVSITGVEIVARPPGKRQQTLALLSGGERSLTAVALIFAILEVSPPPFCILDEVDAMLDEANIKRFRRALERLSEHTQFIIITHNRGTIQAADTIYGVSMGDDSVSQVVSLRLEGERIAAPNGAPLEVMKDG
jgi:chromosome segregation protein